MISQIFKYMWRRKRGNLLILLEILISFLMIFGLCCVFIVLGDRYRQPLHFDYDDMLSLTLGKRSDVEQDLPLKELADVIKGFPQVEGVATLFPNPFELSAMLIDLDFEGKRVRANMLYGSDELAELIGIKLTRGRWFSQIDHGDQTPAVISQFLADELFGTINPIGKTFFNVETEMRVVGVIEGFRFRGELDAAKDVVFVRHDGIENTDMANLQIKLGPATPDSFEAILQKRIKAFLPDWTPTIIRWEKNRELRIADTVNAASLWLIIAACMLMTVALGFLGVLWQNVAMRAHELGLRRAMGATAGKIATQITTEMLVLAILAMTLGLILAMQLPLAGIFPFISLKVYLLAMLSAVVLMAGLIVICSIYPSWLAAQTSPAEALRYE